jgi:hypothetical protein
LAAGCRTFTRLSKTKELVKAKWYEFNARFVMGIRLTKTLLYSVFVIFIIWGQFLTNNDLLVGKPPIINQPMIDGRHAMEQIVKGLLLFIFGQNGVGYVK